jgi:HK97 gp10 family phage protein
MSQDGKILLRLDDAIPGLEELDGVITIAVGVMDEATNPRTGGLVVEYAIYNEFGTQHIPARPAMRQTLEYYEDSYEEGFAEMIMQGMDPETAADILAQQMEGDIKNSIAEWTDPPNTEEVQERKKKNDGSLTGPLKDTGAYLGAIYARVEKG